MGHALSARSNLPLWQVNPWSNPALLAAVVLTTSLQLILIYVKPVADFFGTQPLSAEDLLLCVGFSLLLFLYLELEKIWRISRRSATAHV
jgi:Ca2+-transporting ATPase